MLGKFIASSLANAVVVARTVLEDVDMDVVGMRFIGAWAEHGREPAATRFAHRIDCTTGITGVSGDFVAGDPVDLVSLAGVPVAPGANVVCTITPMGSKRVRRMVSTSSSVSTMKTSFPFSRAIP